MLPRVIIEGRVVFEPELRFAPSGTAVLKTRIVASDRRRLEDGTWEDVRTLWMDTTSFGPTAERMAEEAAKGDVVIVTGKLSTEEWETDAGEKKSKIAMIIDSFSVLPRREGGGGNRRPAEEPPPAVPAGDEPPF